MERELREASLSGDGERLTELSELFLNSCEAKRLAIRSVTDADRGCVEYRDTDLFILAGIFDAGKGFQTCDGAGEECWSEFYDRAERELHLMLDDAVSGRSDRGTFGTHRVCADIAPSIEQNPKTRHTRYRRASTGASIRNGPPPIRPCTPA